MINYPGNAHALDVARSQLLFSHEYGVAFYLRERVMGYHSPDMPLKVLRWPPTLMRHLGHIPAVEIELYIGGVYFGDLLINGDYTVFYHRYLMRETNGVWRKVIYE